MKRTSEALKVFTEGLENVPASDPAHQVFMIIIIRSHMSISL